MEQGIFSKIAGSGSYIPERRVLNKDFEANVFYDPDGVLLDKMKPVIISQLEKITGIRERRYVTDDLVTFDFAFFAARAALESASIDGETLDHIIAAHNFGDISTGNPRSEFVPSLASRVKEHLGISNPGTIVFVAVGAGLNMNAVV